MPDDRGVREQKQRLGHEGEEGGYGQGKDLSPLGPAGRCAHGARA